MFAGQRDASWNSEGMETALTMGSETSSRFPDNLKLTPVTANAKEINSDLNNENDLQRTIERAREGKTFSPEYLDASKVHSSPSKWDFSSTPTRFEGQSIFNMGNNQQDNPVKGAFNLFDKKDGNGANISNISLVSMSSINSVSGRPIRKLRKRMRPPISDQSSVIQDLSNHSILKGLNDSLILEDFPRPPSSPIKLVNSNSIWHSLITDRQFATNLTIIIQIGLNTIVFLIVLALIGFAFVGIKSDVDRKIAKNVSRLIYEINTCKKDYFRNNCSPEIRVPALEDKCSMWDDCMSQDPQSVITSAAYFEVIADCMNAFFQNLTFRTICGVSGTLFVCVVLPNLVFSRMRSSTTINKTYVHNNPSGGNSAENNHGVQPPLLENQDSVNGNTNVVRFNPNVSYSFYEN